MLFAIFDYVVVDASCGSMLERGYKFASDRESRNVLRFQDRIPHFDIHILTRKNITNGTEEPTTMLWPGVFGDDGWILS
jgi:hypothetical protein